MPDRKPNVERMLRKRDVEGLMQDLQHKDQAVRLDAALALARIGDARAVEPLIRALKEDEDIRATVLSVRNLLGYSRAITKMIQTWKDKDGHVGIPTTWALAEIGEPAVQPLIQTLKDGDWFARMFAAAALGNIGDAKAVEPLIQVLKDDEDGGVRSLAAVALGDLGDARASQPLVQALKDDYTSVQEEAKEALEKIKASSSIKTTCPQCGGEMRPGTKFCTKCGAKLRG